MLLATVFDIHLLLGYFPQLLCFSAYIWPKLRSIDRAKAQRAIATLHSFESTEVGARSPP